MLISLFNNGRRFISVNVSYGLGMKMGKAGEKQEKQI